MLLYGLCLPLNVIDDISWDLLSRNENDRITHGRKSTFLSIRPDPPESTIASSFDD